MWPAWLGGWRVTTDGRHATTLRLEQTQVTRCKAGIQVGCSPFTWALSLPGHTSRFRLFKNRTGSPEQKEGCSTGVPNGEKGFILRGWPPTEQRSTCSRYRKTSQTGEWGPGITLPAAFPCYLQIPGLARTGHRPGSKGRQAHEPYPLQERSFFSLVISS